MGNLCSVSLSIDNLITQCWNCTSEQVKYACKIGDSVDDLRKTLQELQSLRNDVRRRVDVAERQPEMRRLDEVQRWLERVEAMECQVNELIENCTQEMHKKCFGGRCPKNCWSSHKLGKRVARKLEDVVALKSRGVFVELVEWFPSAAADERPSEPTVGTESVFDKIWSHLHDENVGIIGLFGLGGVGKTTLLTQVNNELANTSHSFDVVIWAVVSQDPNMESVQHEIGKKLAFSDDKWKCKSPREKATDIYKVLSKKKFVLLLDDIWKRFDISKVGVPLPNQQNKSKLIFTTRSKDVCGRMEAQKKIEVKCLKSELACELFRNKVGEEALNSEPDIPRLAELVAKECGGLPLALITVGRAMACKKTSQEWNYAIQVLKNSAAEFSGMGDEVFPILHFSYESLPSDTVRSCFLYCSLYPEDSEIDKEKLIDYWIGEGILNESNDIDGAQNQGYDIIGILLNACLLKEDSRVTVKMHDVLRDMALWIACEYGKVPNKFLVWAGATLTEVPQVLKWKGVKKMSLMNNKIERLTKTPTCPELTTLLLSRNHLKVITSGFFQFMHALKVLDLSLNEDLTELPLEICNLISLQYLDLSNTSIRQLPVEFQKLVNLKLLNLQDTWELDTIPPQVISLLSSLRVLRMLGCGYHNDALLEELDCLKHLNALSINFNSASSFQRFLGSPKLLNCTRGLRLMSFLNDSTPFNVSSLTHLKTLHFGSCDNLEDLRIDWAVKEEEEIQIQIPNNPHNSEIISRQWLHSLGHVLIDNCSRLKNLTWLTFAPNLMDLRILGCWEMKDVLCGKWVEAAEEGKIPKPFAKLQHLRLVELPNLESIYPSFLLFPCLRNFEVLRCPKLKKLPLNSNSARGGETVIHGLKDWWNALEWEDEATRNAFMPRFMPLHSR